MGDSLRGVHDRQSIACHYLPEQVASALYQSDLLCSVSNNMIEIRGAAADSETRPLSPWKPERIANRIAVLIPHHSGA